jgi:hypothetical protein
VERDTTLLFSSQAQIAPGPDEFGGSAPMQGKTKERWMQLCEQASIEQDPKRLMKLVGEIARMLAEKEQRLQRQEESHNS